MEIEMHLRSMLVTEDPGRPFTDAVMQRLGVRQDALPSGVASLTAVRARRQRRLWAGVLVAVAAAAMMAVMDSRGEPEGAASPQIAPTVALAPLAGTSGPVVEQEPPAGVASAAAVEAEAAAAQRAQPGIHVVMLPAIRRDEVGADGPAIDAFRRVLMLELGALPGVVVHDAERADANPPAGVSSRITITPLSGEVERDDAGVSAGEGPVQFDKPAPRDGSRINVAITFEGEESPSEAQVTFAVDQVGATLGNECTMSARVASRGSDRGASEMVQSVSRSLCGTAADVASALVSFVRPQFEAWGPSPGPVRQDALSVLRDPASSASQRDQALGQLVTERHEGRGKAPTDEDVTAIFDFIATLPPEKRVQAWRRLGNVPDAALSRGLIRVLREDVDNQVRLEAMALLQPRIAEAGVRTALEQVAQGDFNATMRLAAAHAITEQSSWKEHVLQTMHDEMRPPEERLSAFMHSIRAGTTPARRANVRALLQDDAVVRELVALVHAGITDASVESSRILALLGESGHPAVMDLCAELLRDDWARLGGQVRADALHGLLSHKHDPRVRGLLKDIAATHVDRRTRDRIEVELAAP